MIKKNICWLIFISVLLASCSSSSLPIDKRKPSTLNNACKIANTDDSWKQAFLETYKRYRVPPHVIMAIIHQESKYVYNARPPGRPTTAYGYSQALDGTWDWYQEKTGKYRAKRTSFVDSVDFIGWYIDESTKKTGTSKWDARRQYLAYHEGTNGYLRGSHRSKSWLRKIAKKVAARAARYQKQLKRCD